MEGRLLLKNCSLFRSDGRVRAGMTVLIDGRCVVDVAADEALPVLPGDWEVRCQGRLVTAALIDCHTRLVNAPLTPWSGASLLRSGAQRHQRELRLAGALTVGEIEAITAFSLARNARAGVGMVVEHLSAPSCVESGLEAQARAARSLGLRLINAHASSSDAPVSGPAQVEANAAYAIARREDPLVRGAIGVRASFCADDELLRVAGRVKEERSLTAHFGLAESDDDLASTWAKTGARIVTRFERFGLLGGGSVAAHARAIDRHEAERLAQSRTLIACSPRASETMEGGGALGLESVLGAQNLIGLCTSGYGSLFDELATTYTELMKVARAGRLLDSDNVMASLLVGGPAELCTMTFGLPCGSVESGALADLTIFDFVPAEEHANFTPHLYTQLSQLPVAWTLVDGRVVVREGQLLGADFLSLARESALALRSVWRRAGVEPTA